MSHFEETLQRDVDLIRDKVRDMAGLAESALYGCMTALAEKKRQLAFGTSCRELGAWLVDRGYALYRVGAKLEPYTPSDADPPSLNVLAVPEALDVSVFSPR